MSLRTRRIFFYGLAVLFVVVGSGIVFYCQGWRLNVENCHFLSLQNCRPSFRKAGGLFVQIKPDGATIEIDNKIFKDQSGFFRNGTLISNLFPKIYSVKIQKPDYVDWQKEIQIKPGLVAELVNVILVPQNIEKRSISLSRPVDDFSINYQEKIIFKSGSDFYYLQGQSPFKLRGSTFIDWSQNGSKILLNNSSNQNYYLYQLDNLSKILNVSAVFNNLQKGVVVKKMVFHPADANKLIIETKTGLSLLDLNQLNLETFVKEPVFAWTVKNPNVYYITQAENSTSSASSGSTPNSAEELKNKNYYLKSFNLTVKVKDSGFELPVANSLVISRISASGNKIAILAKNGSLYVFNRENQNFEQITRSAVKFVFSPDNKKIAFSDENGELKVYFLEDHRLGIDKKAGETTGISLYKQNGQSIKDFLWYKDSSHLFVDYVDGNNEKIDGSAPLTINPEQNQRIDFIELDDRQPMNKYVLLENVSTPYYDSGSNRLYFLQQKNLYFIEI